MYEIITLFIVIISYKSVTQRTNVSVCVKGKINTRAQLRVGIGDICIISVVRDQKEQTFYFLAAESDYDLVHLGIRQN